MLKNLLLVVSIALNLGFINYLHFIGPSSPVNEIDDAQEVEQSQPSVGQVRPAEQTMTVFETDEVENPDSPEPGADPMSEPEDDYMSQVSNWRAEGLDEALIREMILTRINRDHEAALDEERTTQEYWLRGARNRQQEMLDTLEFEANRRGLLVDLFGESVVDTREYAHLFRPYAATLDFLPSQKQIALREITVKAQAASADLYGLGFIAEYRDVRANNQQEMQRSLMELLDADELFEYQVRESRLAGTMRMRMQGFDYSEQEFRDLYRIYLNDLENADARLQMPAMTAGRLDVDHASENAVRSYLGLERYADFVRTQDPVYRTLQSVGDQYGRSDQDIIAMYEIVSAANLQAMEIRDESESERRTRIQSLRDKTRVDVAELVGDDIAESVERNTARYFNMRGRRFGGRR